MEPGLEEWKPVKQFEGYYEVSSKGRIRSLDKEDRFGRSYKGRILKSNPDGGGYLMVYLSLPEGGNFKTKKVHRLVAEHFVKGDQTLTVNHLDGVKSNNEAANLEWVTQARNNQHKYDLMNKKRYPVRLS